jgi:predicted transcriptional regulator of viral defense system
MKKTLGELETRFFAYAQMRRLEKVQLGEMAGPLRISARQEQKLLSQLGLAGMIARVRRGLYLVPPRLPLGGKWSPDEILALNTLMEDQQGRYQITGLAAFNRYGFNEQVPMRVYAYNNRLSCERNIGAVALTLIKVADQRLGSTEEVKTEAGLKAVYSSRVRTLVDAVYDWSRFGSIPRAYDWIRMELKANRVSPAELVSAAIRYGNQGTVRRIGALLERESVKNTLLQKLERTLKSSTSLIPWIPGLPKRGKVNRRWGVVLNEQD